MRIFQVACGTVHRSGEELLAPETEVCRERLHSFGFQLVGGLLETGGRLETRGDLTNVRSMDLRSVPDLTSHARRNACGSWKEDGGLTAITDRDPGISSSSNDTQALWTTVLVVHDYRESRSKQLFVLGTTGRKLEHDEVELVSWDDPQHWPRTERHLLLPAGQQFRTGISNVPLDNLDWVMMQMP